MAGPQEQRLTRAVAGMSVASLRAGAGEWDAGAQLLDAVVHALEMCGPDIQKNFGGRTASAAQASFAKVTERVGFRSGQMTAAGKALADAADALYYAGTVKDGMGSDPSRPSEPTSSPEDDEMAVLHQQVAYNRQLNTYNTQTAERETTAQQTADQLDATLLQSTETMKQVHGEPDPGPTRTSGADGGAGGGMTTTGGGQVRTPDGTNVDDGTIRTPTRTEPTDPHQTHQPTDGDQAGGGDGYPPTGSDPGQGSPQGPSGPTVSVPGGVTAPTLGGVAGALGGGPLGGLAGVGGAVRGPSVATGGFSAGGPRAIGGVTRPGAASGTLGRGPAGVGSPGGAASRGGARAGTGARAAGGAGGGSGRAGARSGSRGKAGGRGASVGGARAARTTKDLETKDDEFFLEEQDWLDDEGAAPGVLD